MGVNNRKLFVFKTRRQLIIFLELFCLPLKGEEYRSINIAITPLKATLKKIERPVLEYIENNKHDIIRKLITILIYNVSTDDYVFTSDAIRLLNQFIFNNEHKRHECNNLNALERFNVRPALLDIIEIDLAVYYYNILESLIDNFDELMKLHSDMLFVILKSVLSENSVFIQKKRKKIKKYVYKRTEMMRRMPPGISFCFTDKAIHQIMDRNKHGRYNRRV